MSYERMKGDPYLDVVTHKIQVRQLGLPKVVIVDRL